jgi:exonuclease SbcC
MRPLKLSLEGFTCFRSEQHLDFSKLDLFAISGPTGAGKSSVLDAMTYALYGRVYRIDGITELISQGSERLWVTFDFEVGRQSFRVHRSLRRKTRTGDAQLDELSGGQECLASGTREVNPAVERLIGLSYTAFVQAVVLPQGAFQQFLKSEPAKRRKLLIELFSLERYEAMKKVANERAALQGAEIGALETRLDDDYAGVTETGIAERTAAASKARVSAGDLARKAEELAAAAERAKELNRLTRELAEKTRQRKELAGRAADRTRDEQRLELARRAAPVAAPKARHDEAAEQVSVAKRASGEAAKELASAAREFERA